MSLLNSLKKFFNPVEKADEDQEVLEVQEPVLEPVQEVLEVSSDQKGRAQKVQEPVQEVQEFSQPSTLRSDQRDAPRMENPQPSTLNPKPSPAGASNAVDIRLNTINAIVDALRNLHLLQGQQHIQLYVTDMNYLVVMNGQDFINDLRLALDNALLTALSQGTIQVFGREVPAGLTSTQLMDGKVTMCLASTAVQQAVNAVVSIYEGQGSLAAACYVLDATKKTRYHIGRGRRGSEGFRINDIIIRDNEQNEDLASLNAYVSSSHADIVIEDGRFFVQACPKGCQSTSNNATKVVRDEQVKPLMDTNTLFPLQDGDLIELGRSVILQFKIK